MRNNASKQNVETVQIPDIQISEEKNESVPSSLNKPDNIPISFSNPDNEELEKIIKTKYPKIDDLQTPYTVTVAPNGNLYLEIEVKSVYEFNEGWAYMDTGNWRGYINENLEKVLTLPDNIISGDYYDEKLMYPFYEGLTIVAKNYGTSENPQSKYGYMDKLGKITIDYQFDKADRFSDGIAIIGEIKQDGKSNDILYGYINKNGRVIIDCQFDAAQNFKDGVAKVRKSENEAPNIINHYEEWLYQKNTFFIDKKGMPIITDDYFLVSYFCEGLGIAYKNVGFKKIPIIRYGFVDQNRNIVIPLIYNKATVFTEGLAMVSLKGKNYFVNKKGERLSNFEYSRSPYSEGFSTHGTIEVIRYSDRNGQLVMNLTDLWYGYDFSEGLACVATGENGICYINKRGEIVIPHMTTESEKGLSIAKEIKFSEGLAAFYDPILNDSYSPWDQFTRWGIMDKEGREISKTRFENNRIPQFKNGTAVTTAVIGDTKEEVIYQPVLLKYAGNINHKPIGFQVNGQEVNDIKPKIFNDVIMLPIDEVSQLLQIDVHYNTVTNWYTVKKGLNTLTHEFNKTVFFINDEFYLLDIAPSLRLDGQDLLPVYYLEKLTGYEIKWDSKNFKLEINF